MRARSILCPTVLCMALGTTTLAQSARHDELANLPFKEGFLPKDGITTLKDELVFQRAVQSYLWALPALNMYGMKEGSERAFGKGYNVLPIFKDRLNAKTLITTPNSDVIYALGYLDLNEDGPMVIEVPPGLQGILDDFWQRPIASEGEIAALGIIKGKPFSPDANRRALLDKGAKTAYRIAHSIIYEPLAIVPNALWYADRHWANVFPGNATFTADTFNYIDPRTGFFTVAYSTSPGMAVSMENVGAKYPVTFVDAHGDFLQGGNSYRLNLPKGIPAALFWTVTVYDPVTGSGLDNGQPFPSLNAMDKPAMNADGSTDIYFGPSAPGAGKNWLATVPGKGWFTILRLYGPTKAFFDKAWKPGDVVQVK